MPDQREHKITKKESDVLKAKRFSFKVKQIPANFAGNFVGTLALF